MPRNLCQMAIKKRIMTAKVIGYMKPDIDPNTRLYVPFNEGVGDLAKDYSQYCNHAQLTDVEWSPGGFNGAGKFNGITSIGNCGHPTSLNLITALTLKVGVEANSFPGVDNVLFSKGDNIDGFYFEVVNDGTMVVKTEGVTDNSTTSNVGEIVLNKKYCLATTFGGGQRALYKNGKNITSESVTGTINSGASINALIGIWNDFLSAPLNGIITSLIVRALAESPAQIAADCYEVVCS